MLPHFMQSLSFRWANLLQATLFGLWHAVWPEKRFLTGELTLTAAITDATSLVLTTIAAGLVFGYLFYKTNSLWTPWLAHTIHNSALNLVHIQTIDGLDSGMGVLIPVMSIGYLVLVGATKLVARRLALAPLESWAANAPT